MGTEPIVGHHPSTISHQPSKCPHMSLIHLPAYFPLDVARSHTGSIAWPIRAGVLALYFLHDAVGRIRIDRRGETDAGHLRGQHQRGSTDNDEPHRAAEKRRRARYGV